MYSKTCTSKTYMKDVNSELSITYSSSKTQLHVYLESLSLGQEEQKYNSTDDKCYWGIFASLNILLCGRAKFEPAVVFLVEWSAALFECIAGFFPKSVHILGVLLFFQLICMVCGTVRANRFQWHPLNGHKSARKPHRKETHNLSKVSRFLFQSF